MTDDEKISSTGKITKRICTTTSHIPKPKKIYMELEKKQKKIWEVFFNTHSLYLHCTQILLTYISTYGIGVYFLSVKSVNGEHGHIADQ